MASLVRNFSLFRSISRSFSTGKYLNAAQVQQPAPDFKGQAVVNGQFKEISLSDFHGKWLILFFYPLDFTFVCPTEIIAFSDQIQECGYFTQTHF